MAGLGRIIPIYQYHAEAPWRYFYTTDPDVQRGWKRDGIAFYAFSDGVRGSASEVVRYHAEDQNPWRFLYSLRGDPDFVNASPGWAVDDSVDKGNDRKFYAFERADLAPPNVPIRPVYQFFAQAPQRYLYSLSATPPGSGWTLESDPAIAVSPGGIVFYVLDADIPLPVF
ncbi:MAG TPA: hypothetical protein V6C57_29595 [Coleofasciculaceae cyanobacterium]